ncbi:replication initiation protein RepM [Acinetobacter pittii]|uniref:replication initiation protein RepM n=1 Tax=Acinetobacter pittii TaxID=48296 RepID=UPI0025B15ECA|nr:replication initiation protein RepM [Acinetobacter pittii]
MSNDYRLVVKDNALINASFNLSLVEQRLMLLAITEARELPELTIDTRIEIRVKDYSEQFKVKANNAYEDLKEAVDSLFNRQFSYYDKERDEHLRSRWIHTSSYIDNKGYLVLFFTPVVISMISRLQDQFTRYLLDQVSNFKSKYSIRLYEIVSQWVNNGGLSKKYAIDELRAMLGLEEDEYKTMSLFKKNVLDKAVKEIKDKSYLYIEYKQYRTGRSISHIKFSGHHIKPIRFDKPEYTYLLTDKQILMFADKLSRDTAFQNHYKAFQGESYEEYSNNIAMKLSDPFYIKEWMEYLKAVGYKPKKYQ